MGTLNDYLGAELHGYAPGHDGPFPVTALRDGDAVRFVDPAGAAVLEGPASVDDYSMCGLALHPWGVCADGGPCICKGGAGGAAGVSRFLAGLDGRRGVLTRQCMEGAGFVEPVGPYGSEVVTVGTADRASRPGLYALFGADGGAVEVCGGSFRVDPRGIGIHGFRRTDSNFLERFTLLFPDIEPAAVP